MVTKAGNPSVINDSVLLGKSVRGGLNKRQALDRACHLEGHSAVSAQSAWSSSNGYRRTLSTGLDLAPGMIPLNTATTNSHALGWCKASRGSVPAENRDRPTAMRRSASLHPILP